MNRLILTVCLLLALAACGRPAAPASSAGSPRSTRLPTAAPTVDPPGRDATRTVEPNQPGSAGSGAPTPGTTEPNPSNHFAISFDMPRCIERTRPAKAAVRTAPNSMLIASTAYADEEAHGVPVYGSTDTEGRYTLAWVPPADAPLGPAKLLVGVNGDKGGATAVRHFVLAEPGGCR